jgi:type VI secretion system protein ImpB
MRENRSFQYEIPKERINIRFVKHTGDVQEAVELPLKLLMLGDYTLRESDQMLTGKEKISINKQNFDDEMKDMGLGLKLTVPNRLVGGGEEMTVDLKFENLNSFHPEAVARQVKELNAILAVRNLLSELRSRVITDREFRRRLEDIVKTNLDAAIKDLEQLAPMPKALKGEAKSTGTRNSEFGIRN